MRKKVPLAFIATAGFGLGMLMLFLVANRSSIYLGSESLATTAPLEFLQSWNSNEYLISNATYRLTQENGSFYGARELIWIIARLVPSQWWPTVYEDLPEMLGVDINLWVNGGVDPEGIYKVAGWQPSFGSAEGYVATLWLEFQYLAPIVSILIGWLYGRMWANARHDLAARVVYLLMAALSVYLIMQGLDPWLFRLLLLGVPAYLLLRFVKVREIPSPLNRLASAPSLARPAYTRLSRSQFSGRRRPPST